MAAGIREAKTYLEVFFKVKGLHMNAIGKITDAGFTKLEELKALSEEHIKELDLLLAHRIKFKKILEELKEETHVKTIQRETPEAVSPRGSNVGAKNFQGQDVSSSQGRAVNGQTEESYHPDIGLSDMQKLQESLDTLTKKVENLNTNYRRTLKGKTRLDGFIHWTKLKKKIYTETGKFHQDDAEDQETID